MQLSLIPVAYVIASVAAAFALPRVEATYFAEYVHPISTSAAFYFFSSVATGMLALIGVVFAIAFVMVQFSALAYSPRLVVMFASRPGMFHLLGIFFATFFYSLAALLWTDRDGSGTVPMFSTLLVILLLIVSTLAFARMVQSLDSLQIQNVLQIIGTSGRTVIRQMFPAIEAEAGIGAAAAAETAQDLGPVTQIVTFKGDPATVIQLDIAALTHQAQSANAVLAIECCVGDTLAHGSVLLRVHGAREALPEPVLLKAIGLGSARSFDQDPRFALRLLVDIAIRALSAAINDPTTAVQALDQIEDVLRHLGNRQLESGEARDAAGALRVTFPVPTWEDYLALSFDEIRQFGTTSVQVLRRLRAVLTALSDSVPLGRRDAVLAHLDHLNAAIADSNLSDLDRAAALQEDRQGLGLARKRSPVRPSIVRP